MKTFGPHFTWISRTFLVAQMVKHLPAMWETQVQSLGQKDLLEKEMATYSSILDWKIPRAEEPGRLQSMESQRVGHDWVTSHLPLALDFPVAQTITNLPAMRETPGLGRSPGEGNGNPLQHSCLGNPMDRGAWWAKVHGVTKSLTRLKD